MMRSFACCVLVGLSAAACSGGASSMTSPTAASDAVMAVTVSSDAGPSRVSAAAHLSNGATKDVTSLATWESTNPAVAIVANDGRIVAYGAGQVTFRATYESVTGTLQASVAAPDEAALKRHVLRGTVTAATKPYQVLPRAQIRIIAGPNVNDTTETDEQGMYSFDHIVAGDVTLMIYAAGYETWTSKPFFLGVDMTADAQLLPSAQ